MEKTKAQRNSTVVKVAGIAPAEQPKRVVPKQVVKAKGVKSAENFSMTEDSPDG